METNRNQASPQSEFFTSFGRLATLREEMDRVFGSAFGPIMRSPGSFHRWSPLDVYQDKDSFTVVIDLPGLKKENIEISLREQNLTVSGKRPIEEKTVKPASESNGSTGPFSERCNCRRKWIRTRSKHRTRTVF